ncbi:ATP-binding protein [Actinocrispum sp. NPDC049592]|uniref:ATP-binding protein n=1 Tax=Actinocrispum sp. NPDC049592 TaxID=3154835 RepID=UPI003416838F
MLDSNTFLTTRQPLRDWGRGLPRHAAAALAGADLGQPTVYVTMEPAPGVLGPLRSQLTRWSADVGLSPDQTDDIVLAVDEAMSNAIEHAFEPPAEAGTVTLFAGYDARRRTVCIIVADNGTWQKPPADPGTRGRGLYLMNVLAGTFDLHHDRRGTTVLMKWPLG